MKYVAAADIHIRETAPRFRKDDYLQTGLDKLAWIVNFTNKESATLLIAGDLFDTSKASVKVLNRVAEVLQKANYPPIAVDGQHDLLYHRDIQDTPLFNLGISRFLRVLENTDEVHTISWKAEIPEDAKGRILLMHKCITEDEPPFFLPDAVSAGTVLTEYGSRFQFIVTGDYHVPFVVKRNKAALINCGAMLRNTKEMVNYQPSVFLFDSDVPAKVKRIHIPIAPPEEIFDLEAIDYQEKHGVKMDLTKMAELIEQGFEEMDFVPIVWKVYKETKSMLDKKLIERILNNA